jgi:RND family efflux transporter MFP subunit
MNDKFASNPNQNPDRDSQPAQEHEIAPEQKPISPRKATIGVVIVLLVAAILAGIGILHRINAKTVLAEQTTKQAAPTVTVATPTLGTPVDTYVLPGNVTAYTDSPIYARTSGYLTRWYFDIGSRVKKGALLATISTPEVDQQLAQSEADLLTAQANARNARIQADRYSGLVTSNAVSRQDTDTFVNQAAATEAAVRSAKANVDRLHELQSFEKVYAPFDGVITARTVDTGQLIDAGAARELFHLQAIQTLRVYVNVPQVYSQSAKTGAKIDLVFTEHPGKTYQGTLVRTAQAIDPVSRTLPVEIDVDNHAGELLPGSLAQVHFKTHAAAQSYVIPVAALIFRKEGLSVATVVNGNIARLAPVTIGEDDGATVQIVTGIGPGDKIIQDPPDSLIDGEKVTVVSSEQAGGK